jgi:hypothetical protein
MSIPLKDPLLVAFGANFDQKGSLDPALYSLTVSQMASFHAAYATFVAGYNAVATAREAGARSKLLTRTKDQGKADFLRVARVLYMTVQNSATVSDANREDIGVVVRKTTRTPIARPATAPGIAIVSTVANTVTLRLYDVNNPTKRAKPRGVDGAAIFSFTGAAPPSDEAAWTAQALASKAIINITFPASTPPGAKVYFTAYWFNKRKQNGPAAVPVGINIAGGAAMAA